MTRLYRTILGLKSGPPVGTFAVTFSVKEWMLDPDNAFTDTEVGPLHYMTVKIDGVEQLTDALGVTVFDLLPGTYTYEVYDMVRYLTTKKGTIEVAAPVAVGVKLYACLYTPTQVNEIISVQGYIPVASAAELDGLRNTDSRRMGQGTVHDTVGNVITGVDKKYVQVDNLDLVGFAEFTPILEWRGLYDGNELKIDNFNNTTFGSNVGLFSVLHTDKTEFYNIRVINANVQRIDQIEIAGIVNRLDHVDSIIKNCHVVNSTIKISGGGGIVGDVLKGTVENCFFSGSIEQLGNPNIFGGIAKNNYGLIKGCNVECDVISTNTTKGGICAHNHAAGVIENCNFTGKVSGTQYIGGIVGRTNGNIDNCHFSGTVNATTLYTGGFAGEITGTLTVSNCSASGTVNNTNSANAAIWVGGFGGIIHGVNTEVSKSFSDCTVTTAGNRCFGGFVGGLYSNALAENCYALGSVSGANRVGGFAGQYGAGGSRYTNCYAAVVVTATGTAEGGFAGFDGGGTHVFVNCYYDTNVSGRTDTGKGLPRTTAQMQAGTASSFINPDGTIDATQNAANAMYTSWSNDIWDFGANNEYPELK